MNEMTNDDGSHSDYFDAVEYLETRGLPPSCKDGGDDNRFAPTLESLPPELRFQILASMPDLLSLRSLVRASPVLHAQYLHDRSAILCSCMERELDGFVLDAFALPTSRVRYIGSPRTDEKIKDFLEGYGGWISGSRPYLSVAEMHPSSLRWIAAYHTSVALPLAHRYAKWAIENLTTLASSVTTAQRDPRDDERIDSKANEIKLSRSEEIRIFRALYRYDTFYHLFGQNRGVREGTEFLRHNVNDTFCGLFHPWEVEAFGTVDLFVREQYHKLFEEVMWDLCDENPRFHQNGNFYPSDSLNLKGEYDYYMDGTVARGLDLTSRLLAVKGHENLVAKMERCLTHSDEMDYRMRHVLSFVAQADRRDELPSFPTARDEAEQRRDALEFVGDSVPPDGPPFGWCLLWNNKCANIYGQLVPEPLRRTGYVVWDAGRWDAISPCSQQRELVVKIWADDPLTAEWVESTCDWSPVERGTEEETSAETT
ncbi:hypothetical protein PG993_003103 [Apiospora rasikravindrae]|uniref:F-box domain-containing protein n=1 Tax=Apiospora rasikravindrae TaxID=990691 RepID=A0ABR1TYJ0_9PEZI